MESYSFVLPCVRVAVLAQPSGKKLGGTALQLYQLGISCTSFVGVNAL